jgi:hypothetical protein
MLMCCVCVFSLHRESPDMILVDKPLISEVVLSQLVLLKFAKDRFLGVDTSRQHVPPRVRYGMACLLIRDAIGFESC